MKLPSLPPFLFLDLDDTILDYTSVREACWAQLCVTFAPQLDNICPEILHASLNRVADWYWADAERHRLGRLNLQTARRQVVHLALESLFINNAQVGDQLADAFTIQREEMVRPFPKALEALRFFLQMGIRMALVTNGNAAFQRKKIQRFDLEQYFVMILIESEFGVGKPDLRIFQHALRNMEADPASTWMIGDDLQRDILPAQELGLSTVWIDYAQTGLPVNSPVAPTWSVHSLAELTTVHSSGSFDPVHQ